MSDENASSLQDANKIVIQDMIKCAEQQKRGDASGEAMSWYVNGPSNQVVEVENIFEGQTGDGNTWKMRFIINADLPNEARKHKAHFGCDVFWNNDRILATHKWLPDGMLKVGRPTIQGIKLEEFQTGSDDKNFDNKRYVTWKSISKKYA
ncbi:unnamed protein product [Rotaria magnacalcarata]|uniref:Uncharacterized protein n=1 Tax=Rotaria magnacalcarata TaxID=392030 RepID=A0A819Y3W9_9BILA|nr:unnamed protein product [Rotaria magnacalcarata]CAF4153317.1 unnamed protein product [Rotaria magnacalcarata]